MEECLKNPFGQKFLITSDELINSFDVLTF